MNGSYWLNSIIAAGILALAMPAWAQESGDAQPQASAQESMQSSEGSSDAPMFVVAPHVSVLIPQPFSDLGTWPVFGLELGYILPFDVGSMQRPLQVSLDFAYTRPGASGTSTNGALGEDGQSFEWELTQDVLLIDLTGLWRFMPPAKGLSVYGEIGPRLYLVRAEVESSSQGNDFGVNDETNTHVGFVIASGLEYEVFYGSVYGALEFGWTDLDTAITGDSNSGALSVDLGYRFMF